MFRLHALRQISTNLFIYNRAVKKREQGARGTPLEFRCLLCDAIQTASTATLSNLRRHVARVHEDDFQTYVDLWEIIKKSNRTSTLTVDAKHFEKSSFGFEDGYGKREPMQTMEEGDNDADVGKTEEDGDDAFEFDNETLPDDSSLFGVLYHRYRHIRLSFDFHDQMLKVVFLICRLSGS